MSSQVLTPSRRRWRRGPTGRRLTALLSAGALAAGGLAAGALTAGPAAAETDPADNRLIGFGNNSQAINAVADGEPVVWDQAFPTRQASLYLVRDAATQQLVLLDGGSGRVRDDFPAEDLARPVVDALIYHSGQGWALTDDGVVHKWGNNGVPAGSWTPEADFGGARAEAIGRQVVLLAGGGVAAIATTFGTAGLADLPAAAVQVSPWNDYVRLENGAVGTVGTGFANLGTYTEVISADEDIVDISADLAVSGDGTVYSLASGVALEHQPEVAEGDRPVRAVAANVNNRAYVLTEAGEVVGWHPTAGTELPPAHQVPAEITGAEQVVDLIDGFAQFLFAHYVAGDFSAATPAQIAGEPVVGQSLAGTAATFTQTPDDTVSGFYHYDPDTEEVIGDALPSDNGSYTLSGDDVGQHIVFATTASLEGFEEVVSISDPVGPVRTPVEVTWDESPQITGDPVAGETLTGQAATLASGDIDPDFGTEGVLNEWIDVDDPEGEPLGTGLSLQLSASQHLGTTIALRTTVWSLATEGEVSQVSDPVGPVTLPPLAITGAPVIDGNTWIGQTLSAIEAPVNDDSDNVAVTYQWYVNGTAVPDATGAEFTVPDEPGAEIQVRQIASRDGATDGVDYAESELSQPEGPVREAPAEVFEEATPAGLSGVALVGQTLTGTEATFTPDDDGYEVTNYWIINGGEPVEANAERTLELTDDHVGASIVFRSVATRNVDGETATSNSEASDPVLAALAVENEVTLTGDAMVGETLAATQATFNDPEAEITHTWLIDGEPVENEGLSFALDEDHEGSVIGYRSEATRTVEGITESAESEAFSDEVRSEDDDDDGDDGDGETGPTPPPGDDDEATRCVVVNPDTVAAGVATEVTVDVSDCDGDWAGAEVQVWLFSDPIDLGTATVGDDGTFTVTIPADVPAGTHQLAVYNAAGDLIGYDQITVAAEGAGDGTGTGGSGGGLPGTGFDGSWQTLLAGVMLVLLGGVALVAGRMRKELQL